MIDIYADKTQKGMEHRDGRKLLARGLQELYGLVIPEEEIITAEEGKPFFRNYPHIHFNISHSGEYVVCALGPEELGIDIERYREVNYRRVGRKFLTEEEWIIWEKSPDPRKYFFDQWVRREAYLKWKGRGIGTDLRMLAFDGWSCPFFLAERYSAIVWTSGPDTVRLHFLF
ncbi:MAG: 4'-phosphopantetheinyl transferase family protein [Ruminococcus sp.]|jgi:4'-phosphopantetheinyl transferase